MDKNRLLNESVMSHCHVWLPQGTPPKKDIYFFAGHDQIFLNKSQAPKQPTVPRKAELGSSQWMVHFERFHVWNDQNGTTSSSTQKLKTGQSEKKSWPKIKAYLWSRAKNQSGDDFAAIARWKRVFHSGEYDTNFAALSTWNTLRFLFKLVRIYKYKYHGCV